MLALVGMLALSAPAADARQLKQSTLTDADILNFALNLEVRGTLLLSSTLPPAVVTSGSVCGSCGTPAH